MELDYEGHACQGKARIFNSVNDWKSLKVFLSQKKNLISAMFKENLFDRNAWTGSGQGKTRGNVHVGCYRRFKKLSTIMKYHNTFI